MSLYFSHLQQGEHFLFPSLIPKKAHSSQKFTLECSSFETCCSESVLSKPLLSLTGQQKKRISAAPSKLDYKPLQNQPSPRKGVKNSKTLSSSGRPPSPESGCSSSAPCAQSGCSWTSTPAVHCSTRVSVEGRVQPFVPIPPPSPDRLRETIYQYLTTLNSGFLTHSPGLG